MNLQKTIDSYIDDVGTYITKVNSKYNVKNHGIVHRYSDNDTRISNFAENDAMHFESNDVMIDDLYHLQFFFRLESVTVGRSSTSGYGRRVIAPVEYQFSLVLVGKHQHYTQRQLVELALKAIDKLGKNVSVSITTDISRIEREEFASNIIHIEYMLVRATFTFIINTPLNYCDDCLT